jgi:hypothetical protein
MAAKATRKPLLIRLDEKTMQRIEDFRFDHRMFDRTTTIRYLLNWALDNHEKPKKRA